MKRILISGGAGFIGSHLCERLLKEGNDVICIDNYFTGHKSNIRHLLKHPNFEVIRHDIVYPYMAEVEEIYNLACPASPIYYQHDPIKTTQTSVIGAMNMLAIANRNHAKILQASTSEVYGDPLIHPQPEDYWGHVNPLGLRSCYDEGKRCAESLFMSYYREHGVPVKIVRIFNTYGPKMDINDGRVVSNFIVQALRGDNITIYGDGGQSRSFQYIDDLIEGMVSTAREMSAELGKLDGCSEEEANAVSTMVGLGALKYFILKVDPKKTMLFDPRESIDFNGNTGPFIQYTHARIRSVLRKAAEAGIDFGGAATADYLREEIDLVKSLTEYPSVVKSAGENFAPSVVGAYVYELAKQFNGYYHDHSILKEENAGVRTMRLQLAQQVARVIKEGMKLLGIDVPERM